MKEFEIFEKNVDWTHPVDLIEPLEDTTSELREAALKYTKTISLCMGFILSEKDHTLAAYGLIYALGLSNLIEGKSMRKLSKELNVSYATISLYAKRASEYINLEPSHLQKTKHR